MAGFFQRNLRLVSYSYPKGAWHSAEGMCSLSVCHAAQQTLPADLVSSQRSMQLRQGSSSGVLQDWQRKHQHTETIVRRSMSARDKYQLMATCPSDQSMLARHCYCDAKVVAQEVLHTLPSLEGEWYRSSDVPVQHWHPTLCQLHVASSSQQAGSQVAAWLPACSKQTCWDGDVEHCGLCRAGLQVSMKPLLLPSLGPAGTRRTNLDNTAQSPLTPLG